MSLDDNDLQHMQEDMELLESLFDMWKSRKRPEPPKQPEKSPIDDDLTNTQQKLDIDYFKNNEEIISFLTFVSNLENINRIKDKSTYRVLYNKYMEIIDLLVIALPYLKSKGKQFGIIIPSKIQEKSDIKSKLDKLFKE
jgi:hypothetical protein